MRWFMQPAVRARRRGWLRDWPRSKAICICLGIGVRAPQEKQEQMVFDLAQRTADYLGTGLKIDRSEVRANCDYVGPGYGLPNRA